MRLTSSFDADVQVRSCTSRTRLLSAGLIGR